MFVRAALLLSLIGFAPLLRAQGPSVLVFDHLSANQTTRAALDLLGLDYTPSTLLDFNDQLANGIWDLVIVEANDEIPVDLPGIPQYGSEDWDALRAYVEGGGQAILSFWDGAGDLYENLDVRGLFGVNTFGSFNLSDLTGRTVTPWVAHPVFDGPAGTVGPLTQWTDNGFFDGSELAWSQNIGGQPDAIPLAGWTASEQVLQASIVLFNDGRTIYNGMALDRLDHPQAVVLMANEVAFLTQVPEAGSAGLLALGLFGCRWLRRRGAA
jgi:hypothetical protein